MGLIRELGVRIYGLMENRKGILKRIFFFFLDIKTMKKFQ